MYIWKFWIYSKKIVNTNSIWDDKEGVLEDIDGERCTVFVDFIPEQNKKVRRLALKSALTYKAKDKEIILLDDIKFETNKTKEMTNLLNKLGLDYEKVLVVVSELDENVCLASRNLANIKIVLPEEVNTYDVTNADKMIITEAALNKLEEVLTNE